MYLDTVLHCVAENVLIKAIVVGRGVARGGPGGAALPPGIWQIS